MRVIRPIGEQPVPTLLRRRYRAGYTVRITAILLDA